MRFSEAPREEWSRRILVLHGAIAQGPTTEQFWRVAQRANSTYQPRSELGEWLMAPRNGQEFIDGLRRNPREVWVAGRRVGEVTADPVFQRPINAIAQLYDLQTRPENREVMTYQDGEESIGTSFMIPRSHADLVKRRESMKIWADAS